MLTFLDSLGNEKIRTLVLLFGKQLLIEIHGRTTSNATEYGRQRNRKRVDVIAEDNPQWVSQLEMAEKMFKA